MQLRTNIFDKIDNKTAYLIESIQNRRYLTGCPLDTGFLLCCNGSFTFITDFRYIEAARAFFSGSEVSVVLQKKLSDDIKNVLARYGADTLAVESEYQTVAKLSFFGKCAPNIDSSGELDRILHEMRSVKDDREFENIKEAQKLTDSAFGHILNFIKAGRTEKQIALELEFFMRRAGADSVSFDVISVSGQNSALPHGVPSDKPIENGDFVTMDFGCKISGYCSDMTRTVAVGYATDEMRSVYQTVLAAQKAALGVIKSGVKCSDVDKAARDIINCAGYGDCFGHATGHSVGLDIHESPVFSVNCDTVLNTGTVMTVEPGIYLENRFGVRIEDMGITTDDGFNDITKSDKSLIVL